MELISTAIGLILVNLVLSGDNAVVIGMAAHSLPPKQRNFAIVFGGVAAVVLRIIFTFLAAWLMKVPALQFVGGLLLIWIAWKLMTADSGGAGHKAGTTMWEAIWIITVADVVMSLDNVLAVAAVSRGDLTTLIIGLAMSMPIVLFAGGIVAELINRFPWINYIGAIVILYVGGEMMLEDHFIEPFVHPLVTAVPNPMIIEKGFPILLAILVPVISIWLQRRALMVERAEAVAEAGAQSKH